MTVIPTTLASSQVIPKQVNEDLLKPYSQEEINLLADDLAFIEKLSFRGKKAPENRKPIYLATAGAPGARKSTILESYLSKYEKFSQSIYVDPDQRALKFMGNTYLARSLGNYEVSLYEDYQIAQKAAYDYWRPASNYIANTLLNKAVEQRFDIAHGTTLTGPHSATLLKNLRNAGYEIILVLCGAEDELRLDTVSYRNKVQGFYQTSPEDVKGKGHLFTQRIGDYFDHADELWVHWSNEIKSPLDPAAFISLKDKYLDIYAQDLYNQFVRKATTDAKQQSLSTWPDVLKAKLGA